MNKNISAFAKLAQDTYTGEIVKFNNENGTPMTVAQGQASINQAILDAVGGTWSYRAFQANKNAVFALIEEAMEVIIPKSLEQMLSFAEIKNTAFGDALQFTIHDTKNFKVASVSAGNGDLRRQTILNKKLILPMEKIGVKVYAELDNLLSGRIDWNMYVDRVIKSMNDEILTRVYAALCDGYNKLGAKYGIKGTYEEEKLIELVSRVKAKTGGDVIIYGTLKALAKISNIEKTGETGKADMYHKGYVGKFFSTEVCELEQVINSEDDFVVNDDVILVIPKDGESIVKVAIEGTPIIVETKDSGTRTDLSEEYTMLQSVGVGAIVADNFGAYELE